MLFSVSHLVIRYRRMTSPARIAFGGIIMNNLGRAHFSGSKIMCLVMSESNVVQIVIETRWQIATDTPNIIKMIRRIH